MKRREFLTRCAVGAPLVALAACSKKEKEQLSEAELQKLREGAKAYHESVKFVSETDPIAKTLGYVEDPSNVPDAVRVEKEGVPGKNQLCSNCHFYVPEAGKDHGACQLLQGKGMVKSSAWCKSWAIKRTAS